MKLIKLIFSLLFVVLFITSCANSGGSLNPNSETELNEKIYFGPDCATKESSHFVVNKDIYSYKVFKNKKVEDKDMVFIAISYKPQKASDPQNYIDRIYCKAGSVNYNKEIIEHLNVQMRAIVKRHNAKQVNGNGKIAMIHLDKYCTNDATIIANRDYNKYRVYPDRDDDNKVFFSSFYFDKEIPEKFRVVASQCSEKYQKEIEKYLDDQIKIIRDDGLKFNPRK